MKPSPEYWADLLTVLILFSEIERSVRVELLPENARGAAGRAADVPAGGGRGGRSGMSGPVRLEGVP